MVGFGRIMEVMGFRAGNRKEAVPISSLNCSKIIQNLWVFPGKGSLGVHQSIQPFNFWHSQWKMVSWDVHSQFYVWKKCLKQNS